MKDEEAIELKTLGMVIDLLLSKLAVVPQTVCWSQRAFYLLRRALMEHAGAAREAIRPDSELQSLIHPGCVPRVWPALELAIQAKVWPSLVRPGPLVAAVYTLACVVFLEVLFLALPAGIARAALYAAFGTLAFAFAAILATKRCRTRIPQNLRRIRDLVPYAGSSDRIEWTRQKVSTVVRVIVMQQLGLSKSDYREDADFAKDLGLT
ncbi:MAG: hypothetical protein QM570_13880 [Planctomycetota bacterium]|nr:hypothetical protein [Planctomycetota bacterium]